MLIIGCDYHPHVQQIALSIPCPYPHRVTRNLCRGILFDRQVRRRPVPRTLSSVLLWP